MSKKFDCERKCFALPLFGDEHHKITFEEKLQVGAPVYLGVTHEPSGRRDVCIELVNGAYVDQGRYRVYETHVIDTRDWKTVYLQLENTNMDKTTCDAVPFYRPVFNFFHAKNYRPLDFVAPDEIKGVDARIIPQSVPLWSKKKGQITSSGVPRFLGYFIPDPESRWPSDRERAKTWTLQTKEEFTGGKSVNVRFGAQKEWEVVEIYLHNFPNRTFCQTGYTVHPGHPKEWGASPDGVIECESERWPVEIKSSMWNDRFEGYYLVQVYWEMMCLGTQRGELIKYSEEATNDNMGVVKKCKLAVIERKAEVEEKIVAMVQKTKKAERERDTPAFKELVFSPEYRAMRDELDAMAADLDFKELEICEERIAEMSKHRDEVCLVERGEESEEGMHQPAALASIGSVHKRLISAVERKEKSKIIKLATEQIQNHADLIKEFS